MPLACTTSYMHYSSSKKSNSPSPTQEIPSLVWNQKVQYRVHKSPKRVLIVVETNPATPLTPSLWTIKWSLPFRFSDHKYASISHPCHKWYMPLPPHSLVLKILIRSLLYLVQTYPATVNQICEL